MIGGHLVDPKWVELIWSTRMDQQTILTSWSTHRLEGQRAISGSTFTPSDQGLDTLAGIEFTILAGKVSKAGRSFGLEKSEEYRKKSRRKPDGNQMATEGKPKESPSTWTGVHFSHRFSGSLQPPAREHPPTGEPTRQRCPSAWPASGASADTDEWT